MKKYDGVLKRVRDVEEKSGIIYAKTDGRLYKSLKVIYNLAGIWTVLMNLLFLIGSFFFYNGEDSTEIITNLVITVCVCTVMMVAGYVLNCCKLYLAGGILSVIPTILLIPLYGLILGDSSGFLGFKSSYYWRHLVPLLIMVIVMVWITVIAVRARLKTDRMYKKVTENIFNMYNISDENTDILTDEQWEEFLKNYDHSAYKKQFLKQQ